METQRGSEEKEQGQEKSTVTALDTERRHGRVAVADPEAD
jgi:hypothetical protein